jgi:hypothetical protein
MLYCMNLGFGMRFKSNRIQKTYIYIAYQNLDLYRMPKHIFISHSKTYIGINLGFGIQYKSRFWYTI